MNSKKAAIEMSIGTIVIIVLAMTMLIMGVVLIKNIFFSTSESVKIVDRGVKNEINKLFSTDSERKVILFPDSGIIKLKQGSSGEGFAISIRNIESTGSGVFSYDITMADDSADLRANCGLSTVPIDTWAKITAGKSLSARNGLNIAAGNSMENPIHVRFTISSVAPTCLFRVKVQVNKDGAAYDSGLMDVQIEPK